jgi:hypothetical protein
MVEIHEPVRILFVIETTPERLKNALDNLPGVRRLVENRWIRVATIDPGDGAVPARCFLCYRSRGSWGFPGANGPLWDLQR